MVFTVKDLIAKSEFKISVLSGHNGLENPIVWAHTSELENPSEWVSPHYLIMTTGLGIPKLAHKQKAYIQRIIDADLAGLLISDNMNAPNNLTTLITTAEQHNFPILMMDYNTPFIEVAKVVTEANKDKVDLINQQLSDLLYDNTKELIKEHDVSALLIRIKSLLNIPIYLCNKNNLHATLFNLPPLPNEVIQQIKAANLQTSEIQKIYHRSEATLHLVPLKTQSILLVMVDHNINHDLLQRVALLFSLYLENKKESFLQQCKLSSEFLDDILSNRVNESYIEKKLPNFNIELKDSYIAITRLQKHVDYQKKLFKASIHCVIHARKQRLIIIVKKEEIDRLIEIFPSIGISNLIKKVERINAAFQEAMLAYKNSSGEFPTQHYAEQHYARYTLPRNISEAQHIFKLNLGVLYAKDQEKNTRYVHTLKVFLDNDRSWERTAKILHIHKQTLVYRVQKIQEITGRQINSTADIVELWLAIKAGEILRFIEEE